MSRQGIPISHAGRGDLCGLKSGGRARLSGAAREDICARNDNGLANEMRASKAMFGWWSARGKTGLLEFMDVWSRMWCVLGWQKTGEGRKSHVLESHCVDFMKLD
jgi:hypothetical protein